MDIIPFEMAKLKGVRFIRVLVLMGVQFPSRVSKNVDLPELVDPREYPKNETILLWRDNRHNRIDCVSIPLLAITSNYTYYHACPNGF